MLWLRFCLAVRHYRAFSFLLETDYHQNVAFLQLLRAFVARQGLKEQIVLGIGGKCFVPIRILRLLIGRLPASLEVVNQCFKMDVFKKKKDIYDIVERKKGKDTKLFIKDG